MAKNTTTPKLTTKKHIARQEREEKQVKTALIVTGIILAIIAIVVAYVLIDNYIIKPNRVLATVGDTKIKVREFDANVRYTRENMLKQASQYYTNYAQFQSFAPEYAQQFLAIAQRNAVELNQGDIIGNRVLNDMIDDILIAEEAEKLGITVSNQELDTYIQEQFGFFANGTPTPENTATPFNTPTVSGQQETLIALPPTEEPEAETEEPAETPTEATEETPAESTEEAETTEPETEATAETETEPTVEATPTTEPTITPSPTPYTEKLFNKELRTFQGTMNKIGVSKSDIRRILHGAILRTKVMEVITANVPAEEEQVWARHILVASLDEAEAVVKRLNDGEDFAELAKELSTDPGSKDRGGDLGWFGRGRMVPEFENASFALENIGDISEPVNSTHGWHVIQLIGKGVNPINSQEHERLKNSFFETWLTDLRSSREDIEINEIWKKFTPMKPEIPRQFYDLIMNPTGA